MYENERWLYFALEAPCLLGLQPVYNLWQPSEVVTFWLTDHKISNKKPGLCRA